jgi:hypothetical protein
MDELFEFEETRVLIVFIFEWVTEYFASELMDRERSH